MRLLELEPLFDQLVALDDVVLDPILELLDGDTALGPRWHLLNVVLDPAQGRELSLVKDLLLPPDDNDGALGEDAVSDQASRSPPAAGAEDGLDLGFADLDLLLDGLQAALHGRPHLVDQVVDHRVRPQGDVVLLRLGGHRLGRLHVEAEDHATRGNREVDVRRRDVPGRRKQVSEHDGVLGQRSQRGLDCLARSGRVRLQDNVHTLQDLVLGLVVHAGQRRQRDHAAPARHLGQPLEPPRVLDCLCRLAGPALGLEHFELVSGLGDAVESEHLGGEGRTNLGDVTGRRLERPHLSERSAGRDAIADLEMPVLNDERGDRARLPVQTRLQHRSGGLALRVRDEVLELGHEQHCLEKLVHAGALLGRDVDHGRLAAPLLGNQLDLGELLLDPVRVCALLVHFIDRDDDRNAGCLGMADGLQSLGPDPVVRGDDDDGEIRDPRTAGTHRAERLRIDSKARQ